MTLRSHALFWLCTTLVFLATVWILGDVLLPFVVGAIIAYLLGPLVGRLINAGVPRSLAALLLLSLFSIIIIGLSAVALPFAYRQAAQLAENIPTYTQQAQDAMTPYIAWVQDRLHTGDLTAYQTTLKNHVGKAFEVGGTVLATVIGGGQAIVGVITFIILTPIVAFFMMAEWVRLTAWIDDMIPRRNYETIRGLLTKIDRKLSGFVRGQISVSVMLAIGYALALSLAGLDFGVLIGLMAGILSVIPLIGSSIGLVAAVLIAWFQSHDIGYVGLIAMIFLIGQFLEGNVITPRIMGKSVGLHPLWILFALMAGGALLGIVGMLLAVPVAAVIGVLLQFAIEQYHASPYYGPSIEVHKPAGEKKKKKKTAE